MFQKEMKTKLVKKMTAYVSEENTRSHIRTLGTNIYGAAKNQNQDFEKLKDNLLAKIYILH